MTYSLPIFADLTALLLRIVLGLIFVYHGAPKFFHPKANARNFREMGFRPAAAWGFLAASLEFLGGIALIIGLATQLVSGLFALEFIIIVFWKLKGGHSFKGDMDFDLLILASAFLIFSVGPGVFSLGGLWSGF